MVCAYLYQNIYAYITYKYITHILTHILCINMRSRVYTRSVSSGISIYTSCVAPTERGVDTPRVTPALVNATFSFNC